MPDINLKMGSRNLTDPVRPSRDKMSTLCQGPSETAWDHFRLTITTLYRDWGLTQKELCYVMEQVFGFKATRKMYNTRIRNWGIKKSVTAAEKQSIADELMENRDAGIYHTPMRDGRPFTRLDKIDRFIKIQKSKSNRDFSKRPPTKRNRSCNSQFAIDPAMHLQRGARIVEGYANMFTKDDSFQGWLYKLLPGPSPWICMSRSCAETFLHAWKEETSRWISTSSASSLTRNDEFLRSSAIVELDYARQAIETSRLGDGDFFLNKFCDKAKDLLKFQYWPLMSDLVYSMHPCWWDGLSAYRTYIQGFLLRMNIAIYGETHARTQLLKPMLDTEMMRGIYGPMLKLNLDTVMEHDYVDPEDIMILIDQRAHLVAEELDGQADEEFSLPDMINLIQKRFGSDQALTRAASLQKAQYYFFKKDFQKAREILQEVLGQCNLCRHGHGDERDDADYYSESILLILIDVCGCLELYNEAEKYSRIAMEWCQGCSLCEGNLGRAIALQEEALLRQGKFEEAEPLNSLLHSTEVTNGYYRGLRRVEMWPEPERSEGDSPAETVCAM